MKSYKDWNVYIRRSTNPHKKYMAVFRHSKTGQTRVTHFGAKGYSDFTKHKNTKRRARYVSRHTKNENWNDPFTAGSLSKWVLWNKPSLIKSIHDYKNNFGFRNGSSIRSRSMSTLKR